MTRKRHLTARIKPATRDALKDQLALAADTIIRERKGRRYYAEQWRDMLSVNHRLHNRIRELESATRPLWRRLLGLR